MHTDRNIITANARNGQHAAGRFQQIVGVQGLEADNWARRSATNA